MKYIYKIFNGSIEESFCMYMCALVIPLQGVHKVAFHLMSY